MQDHSSNQSGVSPPPVPEAFLPPRASAAAARASRRCSAARVRSLSMPSSIGLGAAVAGAAVTSWRAPKVGAQAKICRRGRHIPRSRPERWPDFEVPEDKCFSGFDACQKALAVPGVKLRHPGQRPPGLPRSPFQQRLNAGSTSSWRKPVAVDGPGLPNHVRRCRVVQRRKASKVPPALSVVTAELHRDR